LPQFIAEWTPDLIDRYVSGSYYPGIQKAFRTRQVHQTKDESFPRQQSVNLYGFSRFVARAWWFFKVVLA
jgi:hypothetical protein